MKEKGKLGRSSNEEDATKSELLNLGEVEDNLLSSPFYKHINEFVVINTSLENARVPEKSAHYPRK